MRKKTFEVGEGVCEGPRACDEIVVTVRMFVRFMFIILRLG